MDSVYNTFSEYLINRYGEKTYKLPIALPVSCPNRDGTNGVNGCTFCGEIGTGYENLPATMTITEQIAANKAHIVPKYKATKFIPYLQNFSNTYLPLNKFEAYLLEAVEADGVVAVYIATRPDCIRDDYLAVMKDISVKNGIDICVELGLQTVNYHSLDKINRGHSLAEFVDAVLRVKRYGLLVCSHLILNLPWDTDRDAIEAAHMMSALQVDQVKLHALYIVKGTEMARQYAAGEFQLIGRDEYQKRVILFLRHLSPDIVLQRIIGRAPAENTLFSNWGTGWFKIRDGIIRQMTEQGIRQGDCCNYLNGPALRKFT
ncbi:MAG: TIGR01212 family radical SAM protein [Anaerovibrio sp.]|uniref:TIGR01212 family radical SAM protein n=1 Tax=Anaerovibrio sp. TaxID=1872532 RepID=UPI0025D43543|nr:TIGR01212 family radical SAM protein [Anaerovibrio sp.]MCR5176456.1 TIGR01212 family radical SAM protein [Anaerovibrio sp.]